MLHIRNGLTSNSYAEVVCALMDLGFML